MPRRLVGIFPLKKIPTLSVSTTHSHAGCVLKCTLPGHTYQVRALDFSHDDSFLLSGSTDETVMIWQMDKEVPFL